MSKRIYLTILLLPLLFASCKTADKVGPVQYEYLLVERQGGGQLDFRIYPGESHSHLNVYVSSSDFQPVEKRFQIDNSQNMVDAIDEFYKALNGQLPLKGKQKSSGKLKGTWLSMRFVHGNNDVEITDPEMIQRFAVFEKMVREQIGAK